MKLREISFHEWIDVAYLPFDSAIRVFIRHRCNSVQTINHVFIINLN